MLKDPYGHQHQPRLATGTDGLQPQHHIARFLPGSSSVGLFSGCNSEPFPPYVYPIYH